MRSRIPGILLALAIALPAWWLGRLVPVVGGPILGILVGMLLARWNRPASLDEGVRYTSKKILQYAIVFLGFEMSLFRVFEVGGETLVLMLFTLTATFIAAWLMGRALRLESRTTTLIGVGTAICGGSAIAATAPVIDAEDDEVARAISTIFLFNVVAAFLFPALGHLMGMSDHMFGVWAGTAINDASSVVAAGYSYSDAAGSLAVIVKLTRTLAIVPIALALALWQVRTRRAEVGESAASERTDFSFARVFPWFVIGFLAAALIGTFVPGIEGFAAFASELGKFMIVMAMAAIGLNTDVVKLVKSGAKPLALGAICWAVLAVTSLVVQNLL